jgi:exopolysaccharide biosynthesis WecB/TagA/CpsF family protein
VLAVGVGAPKQEKWICKYKDRFTHVKIFMAVGATIDFEAGVVQRSPKWMSKFGLEWLFRISADPKRLWKRYLLEDLPFFWLLLKQKLGLYRSPKLELLRSSNHDS